MFVSYVIAPLVEQYRKFFKLENVTNTVEMKKSHNQIREMMRKFMPMEVAILSMVIENLPSPLEGQKNKISKLAVEFKRNSRKYQQIRKAIVACN